MKLNDKNLFFDPGSKYAPYGMLPWAETNVVGLKLDAEGGKWIITNLPQRARNQGPSVPGNWI